MASNFYRSRDGPRFILGHAIELGFILLGMGGATALIIGYYVGNRKRERLLAEGAANNYTPEELSAKGDKAVTFRYMF